MTTFAPAFEETVPWMSGLVNGLQNRLQQFESARHLSKAKRKLKKKFFSLFLYPQSTFLIPHSSFHIPHSTFLIPHSTLLETYNFVSFLSSTLFTR